MRKYHFHLAFGAGCGIGVVLVTWVFGSDSLAVSSFRLSAALANFVGFLNIVPYFLSAILSGSDFGEARGEVAYWVLVFTQWAAVGIGLSALVGRVRGHRVDG
jgi:hypothetical protein